MTKITNEMFSIKDLFRFQLSLRYNIPPENNEPLIEKIREFNMKVFPDIDFDKLLKRTLKFDTPETYFSPQISEALINYLSTLDLDHPNIGLTAIGEGTFVKELIDQLENNKILSTLYLFDSSSLFLTKLKNELQSIEFNYVNFEFYTVNISNPKSYPKNISVDILFGIELLDCLPEKYFINYKGSWHEILFQLIDKDKKPMPKNDALKIITKWEKEQYVPNGYFWQMQVVEEKTEISTSKSKKLQIIPSLDIFNLAKRLRVSQILMIDYYANGMLFQNTLEKSGLSMNSLRFESKFSNYSETPKLNDGKIKLMRFPAGVDVTFAPDAEYLTREARKFGFQGVNKGVWIEFLLENMTSDKLLMFWGTALNLIGKTTNDYLAEIEEAYGKQALYTLSQKIMNLPLMDTFPRGPEPDIVKQDPPNISTKQLNEFAASNLKGEDILDDFYQRIIMLKLFFNQGMLIFEKYK